MPGSETEICRDNIGTKHSSDSQNTCECEVKEKSWGKPLISLPTREKKTVQWKSGVYLPLMAGQVKE